MNYAKRHAALPLLLLVTLLGCVPKASQYPAPKSPETVALALYGGFVIAEEAAATIAENPNTPASVRNALIAADEAAARVLKELRPAAEAVTVARAQLAAGTSTDEQLTIAITNLAGWIDKAAPLIKSLTDLVQGAQR